MFNVCFFKIDEIINTQNNLFTRDDYSKYIISRTIIIIS